MDPFSRALPLILAYEGGAKFTNDPEDPGGATRWGVTLRALEGWRGRRCTEADVRNLSQEEAGDIYRAHYWKAASCDKLPGGLGLMVFDCAVNQGVGRAKRFLQEAVEVKEDGVIGPATLAAVARFPVAQTIERVRSYRAAHYQSLPGWPRFGKGWTNRLNDVAAKAKAWAA